MKDIRIIKEFPPYLCFHHFPDLGQYTRHVGLKGGEVEFGPWYKGIQSPAVASQAETTWQKDVVQDSCSIHGGQESSERGSAREKGIPARSHPASTSSHAPPPNNS